MWARRRYWASERLAHGSMMTRFYLGVVLASVYSLLWVVRGLNPTIPRKVVLRSKDHTLLASTSFRDDSYLRTDMLRRESSSSSQPEIDLPTLTKTELEALSRGERVQKQERSGIHGEGLVVVDVRASADTIFNALARFEDYQSMIPTVRDVNVLSISEKLGTEVSTLTSFFNFGETTAHISTTLLTPPSHSSYSYEQAEFSLSKFRLKVNVLHTIYEKDRTIKFRLNPNRSNPVFNDAQGFWHVEQPEERPDGYSRVYLSASIVASRLLPPFILDYASAKALPRASTWIQPFFAEKTGHIDWT